MQEAAQEGGLLLRHSCKEDRVTCELSLAQEAEQDVILFPRHIKQLARYSGRGAAHQGGPSLSSPTKYSLRHTGENSSLSESDASTCRIETSVLSHEEWVLSPEKSPNLVKVAPTKSTLCSPSSLALMLERVATPQREAYFLVILGNKKCALSLNKVTEPVTRALIFDSNSHMIPQSPIVRNPFDHHQPNKHGGRHRLIGKDINSFNLHRAARLASFRKRDKLIKTYLLTGDQLQRQHTLKLFLTQKTMIQDTRLILRDVLLLDKEAIAGLQCLRSMKIILNKIFRGSSGRISNKKQLIVNVLSACILNSNNNQMSITEIGKQAGFSKTYIQLKKAKSFKKARLIQDGDEQGFELIKPEKT